MQANTDDQFQPMMLFRKPAAITVFGILCIIFGAMGMFSLLPESTFGQNNAANNPLYELIEKNETFAEFMKISTVVGIITSIALILIGIGLLKLYPLARKAAILYGFYSVISTVLATVITFTLLYDALEVIAQGFIEVIVIVVVIIVVLILIFPVLLIIFMLRPNVIEAFRLGPVYFQQMQQQMLNQMYNYSQNPPYNHPQMHPQNQQYGQQAPNNQQYPVYPPYPTPLTAPTQKQPDNQTNEFNPDEQPYQNPQNPGSSAENQSE